MQTYPAGLPHPLREGYGFETENNIRRTPMQSGRARQRVEFTSVPDYGNWSWLLSDVQAQLFVSFRKRVGGDWFLMTFTSPEGKIEQDVRFVEAPQGPRRLGVANWSVSARLEIRDRFTLGPEWAEFAPEYILLSDILDRAINVEKPLA